MVLEVRKVPFLCEVDYQFYYQLMIVVPHIFKLYLEENQQLKEIFWREKPNFLERKTQLSGEKKSTFSERKREKPNFLPLFSLFYLQIFSFNAW